MRSFDELKQLAQALHNARVFRTPSWETALAIVLYGQEIGLGPVSALMNVAIVQGKPTLGASGVAALIKRSGRFDYRVTSLDDQRAVVDFFERRDGKWETIGTSAFSTDDARRAGLGASPTWKAYPRAMLFARALTAGARQHCPSVSLGSIYDPDELDAPPAAEEHTAPDPEPLEGGVEPASAPANGPAGGPTVTLEGLARAYGADAVFEASGGALPATDAELRVVAERLAATIPTVGAAAGKDGDAAGPE